MMAARFQGDVQRRSSRRLSRAIQGLDLGVGRSKPLVEPLRHQFPRADDYGPHDGIGFDRAAAKNGQVQGAAHEPFVIVHAKDRNRRRSEQQSSDAECSDPRLAPPTLLVGRNAELVAGGSLGLIGCVRPAGLSLLSRGLVGRLLASRGGDRLS